jgi:hypothetical protein
MSTLFLQSYLIFSARYAVENAIHPSICHILPHPIVLAQSLPPRTAVTAPSIADLGGLRLPGAEIDWLTHLLPSRSNSAPHIGVYIMAIQIALQPCRVLP